MALRVKARPALLPHTAMTGGLAADGRTPKDTRTARQRVALEALVQLLRLNFPGAGVHGHNAYAAKACPCYEVK